MNHLGTMYATKRRRRNSKSVRVAPKDSQTKSNPSKRHRERLNAELDTLASLLPYEQSVLSKLDKLSILRLSVSYLRTKSYFQAAIRRDKEQIVDHSHKPRELLYPECLMEGDLILQALNGFLLILTCDGEVFYASHTVETYLGFHQSDICHQSVYELVHSEDREELQRYLMWNSHLPTDRTNVSLQEILMTENIQYLERNFTVRFRCLLDNTSGFLRLDIRGRIKILHGQNHKTEEPPLALFAVCTPFGPPSLLEMPQKDSMFKSKHKLDLSLVSMDQRGKQLLGYSDGELANKGGYDFVHYDDLAYVASAHQELLKTGASGLIAYRLVTKEQKWQWLQSSARLVYKNSKPDFILCTHRPLMEEEGRDLLGKRTMDFKVTYLDGGLGVMTDRNALLSDSDFVLRCQRNRRYKSQIRDLLTTCRKRKVPGESYIEDTPYNNVYPYPTEGVNGLSTYATAMPQNLFTAIDNTRFLSPENFIHYRHLGGYYSDYHTTQYSSNGFLDMTTRTCFPYADGGQLSKDDKLYPCQLETAKFNGDSSRLVQQMGTKSSCCEAYVSTSDPSATLRGCLMTATSAGIQPLIPTLDREPKLSDLGCHNLNFSLPPTDCINVIKPKSTNPLPPHLRDARDNKNDGQASIVSAFSNDTRQSVLMWGNSLSRSSSGHMSSSSAIFDGKLPRYNDSSIKGTDLVTSSACKWNGNVSAPKSSSPHNSTSPASGKVAPPVSYGSAAYSHDVTHEGWQVETPGAWRSPLPGFGQHREWSSSFCETGRKPTTLHL
ncbi:aryl hydrocarbon receptor protein 1-like isoform X3 [Centruroides sculpturatus]|uniref:aryl hydrocarbon receptor protein 1-like isoform X3 n=1 Tax=Centruroides sculpturatus TaxID=218467 RepID=UPI000C6E570F|nr:aryl hydrocarbon receptor protein 1-like isoform X3 [Centruroides sculpturatus]